MADTGERDFLVPDLGEGLEEATVVEWLVAVGDVIALNQPLCVLETAKAEVEVPSPHAGTVVALGGAPGDTLEVGALLTTIATTPVSGPAAADDTGDDTADETGEAAPDVPEDADTETGPAVDLTGPRPEPTLVGYGHDDAIDRSRRTRHGARAPRATTAARAGSASSGTTTAPTPTATPPVATTTAPPTSPPGPGQWGDRPRAKPPVRRRARELGIDLRDLSPGSGPDGIVTDADVERAAALRAGGDAPAGMRAGAVNQAPDESRSGEGATIVPVRGVRARIAEHLTTSRREIPDATCGVTVDCTRLLEVRAALNDHASRHGLDPVVTPFSLLCRLLVQSLVANPLLNASFDEDGPAIRLHDAVHLGIGTATDRGLVVTVVHDAQALGVHDLSAEMARLAAAARDATVSPTELTGSTFTVSNFGALGIDDGIPIINHPEAAIVGVGSIRPRPWVVDDEVVARSTASITLAFDHRVCDGAEAGRFLGQLRELVEAPELALLQR